MHMKMVQQTSCLAADQIEQQRPGMLLREQAH